ncbi:hypothetical protein SAMN05421664_2987 [Chryseobacterium soldanellicola]|uniref:Uncharacterized protein n=1 Tax=Chryseobacterium soldanellicola TaxID=311333 RepID=A0A1H1FCR8_9FLAO|nr:hypothetical protein SAMN05421664_2987 [Chryseobacterium soldanellicola]
MQSESSTDSTPCKGESVLTNKVLDNGEIISNGSVFIIYCYITSAA